MEPKPIWTKLWSIRHLLVCWLTPFVWSPLLAVAGRQKEARCGYVVAVMITYWFTEVIPMAITSLIPVVLFPVLQIMSTDKVAKSYFNGTIMVFLGSLIAATAVSKSNLHERIALKVIMLTGTSPRRLMLGFIVTTAFLSMWISNLATVAMMLPIANAALDQLERRQSVSVATNDTVFVTIGAGDHVRSNSITKTSTVAESRKNESKPLHKGILLAICYSANIGGTGTLTGTSTNLVLNGFLKDDPISFSDWFFFNFPTLVLLVLATWLFLTCFFVHNSSSSSSKLGSKMEAKRNEKQVLEALRQQYDHLGCIRFNEMAVLILFGMLLSLWFFRAPDFMHGWSTMFSDRNNYIKDAVPTIFVVLLFFVIPADPRNLAQSPMLLDWKTTREQVSWSVMLLLGGGFAMAKGCEQSGLSAVLGDSLYMLHQLSPFAITLIMCSVSMTLTELVSNTAAINIMLPVIHQMSHSMKTDLNPLSVMLPVTVSCSYAFMLPFASGTNAIIFEAGKMKTKDMLIPGFFLKIICVLILLAINSVWAPVIFQLGDGGGGDNPIMFSSSSSNQTAAV
ncbi:Na(+)/citrate cotransporter isoform X1 [Dermatophagoides farinae]|uniref:Na(+)/citrate cotransporter isoform X1 n=1 Tax=Dermatophagoides farinae TaxID=6954 RepID=UPI003F5E80D3